MILSKKIHVPHSVAKVIIKVVISKQNKAPGPKEPAIRGSGGGAPHGVDHDNDLYEIEIENNLPHDKSGIFSRRQCCDFCGNDHTDNCIFSFSDDRTLASILSQMKYDRNLELTINWKRAPELCNFEILEPENFT